MSQDTTHSPRTLGVLSELVQHVRLAWRLLWDRRVPLWTKLVPLASLAYIIWPLDLLADVVPGLGQLDDLTIVLLGIKAFVSLAPDALVRQYRQGFTNDREAHPGERPETIDTTYRVVHDEPDQSRPR